MKHMFECIKTGCHLYDRTRQKSYIGDLYRLGDAYILKAVHSAYKPLRDKLHFISVQSEEWFLGDWIILLILEKEMFDYDGQEIQES